MWQLLLSKSVITVAIILIPFPFTGIDFWYFSKYTQVLVRSRWQHSNTGKKPTKVKHKVNILLGKMNETYLIYYWVTGKIEFATITAFPKRMPRTHDLTIHASQGLLMSTKSISSFLGCLCVLSLISSLQAYSVGCWNAIHIYMTYVKFQLAQW